MYFTHTRSKLAYALIVISQFTHNHREQLMNIIMRILRYLKSATRKGILFAKNENN